MFFFRKIRDITWRILRFAKFWRKEKSPEFCRFPERRKEEVRGEFRKPSRSRISVRLGKTLSCRPLEIYSKIHLFVRCWTLSD